MKNKTKLLTMASCFAAMILISTMFPFIRVMNEYAHIGDGLIYLAAAVLPLPYSALAAAVGAGLADTFLGFFLPWAPMSLVIKGLMATVFGFLCCGDKVAKSKEIAAVCLAGLINIVGYFLGSWAVYGWAAALAGLPLNLAQSAVAAVIYFVFSRPARKFAGKYIR